MCWLKSTIQTLFRVSVSRATSTTRIFARAGYHIINEILLLFSFNAPEGHYITDDRGGMFACYYMCSVSMNTPIRGGGTQSDFRQSRKRKAHGKMVGGS